MYFKNRIKWKLLIHFAKVMSYFLYDFKNLMYMYLCIHSIVLLI